MPLAVAPAALFCLPLVDTLLARQLSLYGGVGHSPFFDDAIGKQREGRGRLMKNSNIIAFMTGRWASISPLRRLYGFDDTMPLRPGAADYVQLARSEGENKSAVACAPHQVVAMHLSIDRSGSGAQPAICAADAPARD